MRRHRPSPLRPILACGAIAAGNILALNLMTGQLPEGADLFDITNAGSSFVLGAALIAGGLWQLLGVENAEISALAGRASKLRLDVDRMASDLDQAWRERDGFKAAWEAVTSECRAWERQTERAIQVARQATVMATEWAAADSHHAQLDELDGQLEGLAASGVRAPDAGPSNVVSLYGADRDGSQP